MTAEIAIMNGQGIALAADSAVTIGHDRVWQNANKLFSLAPIGDIGVMLYGGGSFLGLPWETVVKTFRKKYSGNRYSTVADCAKAFIDYISGLDVGADKTQSAHATRICEEVIVELAKAVKTEVPDNKSMAHQSLRKHVNQLLEHFKAEEHLFDIKDDLIDYKDEGFREHTKNIITTLAHPVTLTEDDYSKLAQCCLEFMRTRSKSAYHTGIIVAGFGDDQMQPALCHYIVDGRIGSVLRVWCDKARERDMNQDDTGAEIIPFAQSDVFSLFMEGMSTPNLHFTLNYMRGLAEILQDIVKKSQLPDKDKKRFIASADDLFTRFVEDFRTHVFTNNALPIIRVVQTLPKEEMGAMAEALIELTTLRRKFDSDLQSVGGPTDVAIISKGDGFIWLKRKHYFDITMNRDFMSRKSQ